MRKNHVRILANIAGSQDTTPRAQLIAIRRLCRLFIRGHKAIHDERRTLLREAGKLRAFLPFTAARVADLERQADEYDKALDTIEWSLSGLGNTLLRNSRRMTETIGFDGLCDLLNVNRVHREPACRAGHTALHELVFVADLEDSADRHDPERKDGPLFSAYYAAAAALIEEVPKRLWHNLSGPQQPPKLRLVGK